MPLLTGPEIARLVQAGELKIEPYNPDQINPNSYNLRLCDKLLVYEKMMRLHDFYEYQRSDFIDHRNRAIEKSRSYGHRDPDDEVLAVSFTTGDDWYHVPPLEPLDMAVDEPVRELTIPPGRTELFGHVLVRRTARS
jgi:hypothetical protein